MQKLNLLNNRFYNQTLPRLFGSIKIRREIPKWDNWLEWGKGQIPKVVKRGLNVTVNEKVGTYYGEWSEKEDSQLVPDGRGVLERTDRYILGYIEHGNWAPWSYRVVIYKGIQVFGSHLLIKKKDGTV